MEYLVNSNEKLKVPFTIVVDVEEYAVCINFMTMDFEYIFPNSLEECPLDDWINEDCSLGYLLSDEKAMEQIKIVIEGLDALVLTKGIEGESVIIKGYSLKDGDGSIIVNYEVKNYGCIENHKDSKFIEGIIYLLRFYRFPLIVPIGLN